MEGEFRDGKRGCYFHPKQLVIGVCALCLRQRLLLLQQKQDSSHSISLHKVFPFASLLNRLAIARARRRKSDHDRRKSDYDDTSGSISQQDSFISINLEDNRIAASSPFEKKAKLSSQRNDCANNNIQELKNKDEDESPRRLKSLVRQVKPPASSLRWRKRIGQWFQLIRRKRSIK